MARAIATLTVMPSSPDVDLAALESSVKKKIIAFAGKTEMKVEVKPVAFGLNSVNITFVMDEAQGSPDAVAEEVSAFEDVSSAEITDVRRAVG